MATQRYWTSEAQDAFLDAYFNKDREGLFQAFQMDKAVSRLGEDKARKLFDELCSLNSDYLKEFVKVKEG